MCTSLAGGSLLRREFQSFRPAHVRLSWEGPLVALRTDQGWFSGRDRSQALDRR